ncbi:LysR family transcriptional regulator, partial [[Clostridium] symbiosum]
VPSQYLLPQILAKFSELYPRERFKIMETDSAKVVEQVINGNADIGFTGTVLEKKYCRYIPFYQDELVIITPNTEKF